MRRITTATKAVDLFGAGKHGFKDGNLLLAVSPTDLNAEWFNGAQEELLKIIEQAGLAPSGVDFTQLWQALRIVVGEKLLANRTYFVRTDGNNANDGLSNAAGGAGAGFAGAFLTIQRAIDVIGTLDLNGFQATIQLGDGTYTTAIASNGPWVGASSTGFPVKILGNAVTPANTHINVVGDAITVNRNSTLGVQSVKISSTGRGLNANAGLINVGVGVVFGACTTAHMQAYGGGIVYTYSNYSIVGGAQFHYASFSGGRILGGGNTVTITGTPAITQFASCVDSAFLEMIGTTFTGGTTGLRHFVNHNSTISTAGAGTSYFPGSTAGTVDAATFGLFV